MLRTSSKTTTFPTSSCLRYPSESSKDTNDKRLLACVLVCWHSCSGVCGSRKTRVLSTSAVDVATGAKRRRCAAAPSWTGLTHCTTQQPLRRAASRASIKSTCMARSGACRRSATCAGHNRSILAMGQHETRAAQAQCSELVALQRPRRTSTYPVCMSQ